MNTVARLSLNKLIEEKYLIQNTLKASIACIDDISTSNEIKKFGLKFFHRFVVYVTEEDFSNLESFDPTDYDTKHIGVDNRNDWNKIILTLIKHYDPLGEPEFAHILLDIFYTLLGL